ncbi:GntR family transcriptional regulator [Marinococcus halophilus]|uniref:GntR family transcriptional regulator n=2 Tax=Marinococcus halophilus TaxID=1371 RepID=A0A510Y4Q3_MARHA|nr:GntR family transcriptional regulator [Marinococcus halophilus]OZT80238.1 GntR family transcriptional regulator [Marinococcus halophilus]GEK58294.1 GntR family transcriptional regulator [Marinococcus halophilus]
MNTNDYSPSILYDETLHQHLTQLSSSVEEKRLPQKAYQIIRQAIRNLYLPPEKMVLEREMAEVLDMSRTPVREALIRLQTEGLVRVVPRKGFAVTPIERKNLMEIYEIAESLDGLAAELAVRNTNEGTLSQLEALISEQKTALESKNLKNWAILDDDFHSRIIQAAGNERLNDLIEFHADHLFRARLYTVNKRPLPTNSILEHEAIVACLKTNDGKAARTIMESHRRRASRDILNVID